MTLDNQPITGVEVTLHLSPPKVVKTDEKGMFVLKDVRYGRHRLSWKKAGWDFIGGDARPIQVVPGGNNSIAVEAKLFWWATLAKGYVGLVVLLIIGTLDVCLLINYFVLPQPTPGIHWFCGFLGIVILYFIFVKVEDARRIPMLLVLVLPTMTLYYAGKDRVKRAAENVAPPKPSRELEINRLEQERETLIQSAVGKEGVTVSSLCKYGKIEVENNIFEARAKNGTLDKGLKIRVVEHDSEGLVVEEV